MDADAFFYIITKQTDWGLVLTLQVWPHPCPGCGQRHIEGKIGHVIIENWPSFTGRSPSPERQMLTWP